MEKRVCEINKTSNKRTTTAGPCNTRTLQDVHDDIISNAFTKKSKFITKETENAQRAMERYEKEKNIPGAGIQNEQNNDSATK